MSWQAWLPEAERRGEWGIVERVQSLSWGRSEVLEMGGGGGCTAM